MSARKYKVDDLAPGQENSLRMSDDILDSANGRKGTSRIDKRERQRGRGAETARYGRVLRAISKTGQVH